VTASGFAVPAPRVALIGPLNMDLFIRGTAPLDRGRLNEWVGPSDVDLLVAGSIGYTAQAFVRLGDQVELHSHVGSDAFARHIRSTVEQAGIDARHLVEVDGETAIAIYVMLFGGHKRPMTYRLPTFEPWPDPAPVLRVGQPTPVLLHSGGLLHFPGMWHRGQADTFAAARAAGVRTSIDPQFPLSDMPAPWLEHIADVLAHTDVLLCDEGELGMLFATSRLEDGISAAHAAGPRLVAVKRGAHGAVVSDGSLALEQAALAIPDELVSEAVGAGDAFDAGFLDALVRGRQLADAVRFGTAAASLTLLARGGAEGIASRDAVEAQLAEVPLARSWSGGRTSRGGQRGSATA
jgi:2-dehydro-3-deoxygluconokinase